MSKRENSKYKIDRRLRVNLWGRPKSPINKREYGPGQHGQRRKKATDYGTQLAAKQKLRGYYGNISERQFRRYYEMAVRLRGDSSQSLIELLERRSGLSNRARARSTTGWSTAATSSGWVSPPVSPAAWSAA